MNKENILKVADAIENATLAKEHGIGFNMVSFYDDESGVGFDHTEYKCYTVACIAGWAAIMSGGHETVRSPTPSDISKEAQNYLGLSLCEADDLFCASGTRVDMDDITSQDAVKVLRHLAETGDVDWTIIEEGRAS
jgi:hypothetical protein